MGLIVGWSMGDGAPLSEDIPNKEICDATMGHKSETAIGKKWEKSE
jgi:hypothetical protein